MGKLFVGFVASLVLLTGTHISAVAQNAPTPDELTLRPGDTITWTVNGPHRLRFGGTVGSVVLPPFDEVTKLLDLDPALTADANGVAIGPSTPVKATVKSSATAGAEFFFTCGFPPHNAVMTTVSFKIAAPNGQPARQVEIVSANPPEMGAQDGGRRQGSEAALMGGRLHSGGISTCPGSRSHVRPDRSCSTLRLCRFRTANVSSGSTTTIRIT